MVKRIRSSIFYLPVLMMALLALTLVPVAAQTFPGKARDLGCDPALSTPIKGKDGKVLYWNNPTCQKAPGTGANDELSGEERAAS